jgi:hypothetical protein
MHHAVMQNFFRLGHGIAGLRRIGSDCQMPDLARHRYFQACGRRSGAQTAVQDLRNGYAQQNQDRNRNRNENYAQSHGSVLMVILKGSGGILLFVNLMSLKKLQKFPGSARIINNV